MADSVTRDTILQFLREQQNFMHTEFGIKRVALFGSYARNEQTSESDIDLLFDTDDYTFETRCKLKHFLEDKFGKKIDIVYLSAMKTFIKRTIEPELIYA